MSNPDALNPFVPQDRAAILRRFQAEPFFQALSVALEEYGRELAARTEQEAAAEFHTDDWNARLRTRLARRELVREIASGEFIRHAIRNLEGRIASLSPHDAKNPESVSVSATAARRERLVQQRHEIEWEMRFPRELPKEVSP